MHRVSLYYFNCVFIEHGIIGYLEIICHSKTGYFTLFWLSKLLRELYLCCSGHDYEKQVVRIVELIEYWFYRAFAFFCDVLF